MKKMKKIPKKPTPTKYIRINLFIYFDNNLLNRMYK